MAFQTITSEYVALNSVDYSAYVTGADLEVEVGENDVTTMSSSGWSARLGALKSGTLSIRFINDFGNGLLDSALWALLGTVVTFEVRPTSSAVGTSNPKYTGSVLINAWQPIAVDVGDVSEVSVSFPTSGTVTRATS